MYAEDDSIDEDEDDDNCIVLYSYIYIALLAVHTNQKRFQCERLRMKRADNNEDDDDDQQRLIICKIGEHYCQWCSAGALQNFF